MSKKQSQVAQELGKFVQAFWWELPMAAVRNMMGEGDALGDAGWKAYDAWVSLSNETTNQLYESPAIGTFTGRAMETTLRIQQAGNAIASAFFGNLWPAIGLPTSDDVAALRTELASLCREHGEPATEAVREEPPFHRFAVRSADGFKVVRNATVDHQKIDHPKEDKRKATSDEDAAA